MGEALHLRFGPTIFDLCPLPRSEFDPEFDLGATEFPVSRAVAENGATASIRQPEEQ
jgi:hypothetical protein